MNARFFPADDVSLVDLSRFEREAGGPAYVLRDMSTAPDDEDFEAILAATGEQVTASISFGWGMLGDNTFLVGSTRYRAEEFLGWLEPKRGVRRVTVPMVPEAAWCGTRSERFDELCEEEAVDRASGREWL